KNRNIKILDHQSWKNGIGSSIAFGVNYIYKEKDASAVLITLADQPFIDADYLNSLLQLYSLEKNTIVATKYLKNLGVPAIFPKKYFKKLTQLDKDYGAREILNDPETQVKSVDPKDRIADIDTLADYEKLKSKS
ncbi:MAG: NTP transferase domain-containing protein, partial [Leeuwenhoekiella sp.]